MASTELNHLFSPVPSSENRRFQHFGKKWRIMILLIYQTRRRIVIVINKLRHRYGTVKLCTLLINLVFIQIQWLLTIFLLISNSLKKFIKYQSRKNRVMYNIPAAASLFPAQKSENTDTGPNGGLSPWIPFKQVTSVRVLIWRHTRCSVLKMYGFLFHGNIYT